MPNFDVSMDSKVMYGGGSFCLDDDNMKISEEIFAFSNQQNQSDDQYFTSFNWENNSTQPHRYKQFDSTWTLRKRSIDEISSNSERGINSLMENVNEQKKSKRSKTASSLEQWHHQIKEPYDIKHQKLKVTVRRSQKLSDKITALQKLVSPYGKADTASVLQEASLYIKILQGQIQNLFQMFNKSSDPQNEKIRSNVQDIQSRGLCLFPISVMQKLNEDDYCFAVSSTYSDNPNNPAINS